MTQIARQLRGAVQRNNWFYVFSGIAIVLIIASWLVPPMGAIDGSVLAAVGEIFAFAALGTVIKAIDKGLDAKVTHGNTSVTIGDIEPDRNKDAYETDTPEDLQR